MAATLLGVDATRARPARAAPSLWPKEHGAYAMLAFPLVSSLWVLGASAAALLLAGAVVAGFFAHEPLLILLGRRGPRALRQLGDRARPRLVLFSVVAVSAAACSLWLAPHVWSAAMIPASLSVVVVAAVALGREKTIPGELAVAGAFSGACLPLGAAAGAPLHASAALAVVWLSTFALEAVAVKGTLARLKGGGTGARAAAILGSLAVAALGLSPLWAGTPSWCHALLPGAVASLGLCSMQVHPKRLRVVGWTLVGTDVATLLVLLWIRPL